MGGDRAPEALVEGSLKALAGDPELSLVLVGDAGRLGALLAGRAEPRLTVAGSEGAIPMDAHPVRAVRAHPSASVNVGVRLVAEGRADALFTAGHSGAAMAAALVGLGRLPGAARPAIATPLPGPRGTTLLVDAGAQVDCRPEWLAQFSQLGCAYVERVLGVSRPRVGLLSNGTEATKGNQLVQAAHQLIERLGLNYVGPLEGNDLLNGSADVVVCDGFVGNVALKTAEGVAEEVITALRTELAAGWRSRLGAVLAMPALRRLGASLDWRSVGGAPLLGVRGLVFIGHGRSDAEAVAAALRVAARAVRADLLEQLSSALTQLEPAALKG